MIVDQYGQPLSSPKQTRERDIQARYDAAQTTDHNRNHWAMADAPSAVSANSAGVRDSLRKRSRYEIANNSYARGILNTIAAYTVGTGPTLQLTYRGQAEQTEVLAAAARHVERLWQNWSYTRSIAQKLHTMQLALDGDGEAFGMVTSSERPTMLTPVTLDLRLYEADHFDNYSGIGMIADDAGVRINSAGEPIEYAFIEQHPGTAYALLPIAASNYISADQVIHIFRGERPEQLRGIPRLTPCLELFAILRRFVLATCTAAETAADFAAILYQDEATEGQQGYEAWDRINIERGAFLTTPAGARLSQLKAEHPNATFDEFVRAILREIARCLGVPAVVALGDASRYNYSSGRLDLQAFIRQVEVERALFFERKCLDRLWEMWLDEALLIPDFLPPEFAAVAAEFEWAWRWQGLPSIDREKEAAGQTTELANHTTTLAREYARQGLDWATELRQRAAELRLMRELGLEIAGPTQPTQQNAGKNDPSEESSDDEENPEDDTEDANAKETADA